jgi:GxxExxY protein
VDEIISRINAREREEWATLGLSPRSETLVLPEAPSGAPPSVNAAGCSLSATQPAVFCGRPNPLALEEVVTSPVNPATQASLRSACANLGEPFDHTLPSAPFARQTSAGAEDGPAQPVDEVAREVLEASEQVREALGPGLEPVAFRAFFAHELRLRGFAVVEDFTVAESYKGKVIEGAYRVDLLVEGKVIVDVGRMDEAQDDLEARLRHLMTHTGACAAVLAPARLRDAVG